MATKYQCEKVIKSLSETAKPDTNIQGYGIVPAKSVGREDEDGYVVAVYVSDIVKTRTEQAKAPAAIPHTSDYEQAVPEEADKPLKVKAKKVAKKLAKRSNPKTSKPKSATKIGTKTASKAVEMQVETPTVKSRSPVKKVKIETSEPHISDEDVVDAEVSTKDEQDSAPKAVTDYPDAVKTKSRAKDVTVPVEYIETGDFGFGF